MKHYPFLLAFAAILLSGDVGAQVPKLVNYQGRVAVDAVNFEGTGQFKFALVNSDGTTTFWSNDGTSAGGSEPAAAVTLVVAKGLYSVLLGDTVLGNMIAIPTTAFANPDVRLRVWFNDGAHGSQLLTPDQRLAPAAYLADGTVTSASIGPAAVTSGKIAPGAVSGTNIAPASLTSGNFAVPGAPVNGQVLGFNNGGLTWTAPGGGVFSLNGTSAYYNGGNVGIGTDTPSSKLEVRTASFANGFTHSDGTTTIGSYVGGSFGAWFGTLSNHPLHLRINNGTPRLTINTDGNVGIGTLDPTSKLDVRGDWANEQGAMQLLGSKPTLRFTGGADVGNHSWILHLGGDGPGNLGFFRRTGTNAFSYALALGSTTGNVGIGQIDPNVLPSKLQILGQDALLMTGFQPFLSFRDTGPNGGISRIQGVGGDISFQPSSFVNGSNGNNYAALHNNGTFSVKTLTIRGGADLAEPFQMKEEELAKGSVVVIDDEHPGRLKQSVGAYDTRVAGIISGANGVNPGIALHQEGVLEGGQNVALSGRVYVRADISGGHIRPGDLLTTSAQPGRAMRVKDHARAQGAIIGKAMSALSESEGVVLVLVTLQ